MGGMTYIGGRQYKGILLMWKAYRRNGKMLHKTTLEPSYHLQYALLDAGLLIASFHTEKDRNLFIKAKEAEQ